MSDIERQLEKIEISVGHARVGIVLILVFVSAIAYMGYKLEQRLRVLEGASQGKTLEILRK